jgi:hypothetical protein
MVGALGALGLATSVAGAGASALFGNAADRQRRRELDEQLRRFDKEAAQRLGETRAVGAASGIEFGSRSLQAYLSEMNWEFRRQADLMRQTGELEIDLGRQGRMFDLASGVGGALLQFGQSQNWWQKPPLEQPGAQGYSGLPDYLRRP